MHKHIRSADGTELVLLGKVSPAVTTARLGPWSQQALCAQTNSEIFFPAHDDPGTEAKHNAGELGIAGSCHGFASACRGLVVACVDVGGDSGDAAGCAGFAVGVLVPAAER